MHLLGGMSGVSRLCVKGLPKHLTEKRLREHFEQIGGEVTDVRICRTRSVFFPLALVGGVWAGSGGWFIRAGRGGRRLDAHNDTETLYANVGQIWWLGNGSEATISGENFFPIRDVRVHAGRGRVHTSCSHLLPLALCAAMVARGVLASLASGPTRTR